MVKCVVRIWVYSTVLENETATVFFLKKPFLVIQLPPQFTTEYYGIVETAGGNNIKLFTSPTYHSGYVPISPFFQMISFQHKISSRDSYIVAQLAFASFYRSQSREMDAMLGEYLETVTPVHK